MTDRIRIEEPGYVARYRESIHRSPVDPRPTDDTAPGFLQKYRRSTTAGPRSHAPDVANPALRRDGVVRAGRPVATPQLAADVHIVRHGEIVGDEHDADLTDQGVGQARTYGMTLAQQCRQGERVVLRHAGTPRSKHTADHIRDGLVEGLDRLDRAVTIIDPEPVGAFASVRFVGPEGLSDITEGFRASGVERDRLASLDRGSRPLWFTELERFWLLQLAGGDPVELWLTTPMLHFEPPSMVVRRFWAGIDAQAREHPGARLVVATHTGCIRALAVAALGYDPGDLYNLEDVRVKLFAGRRDALVSHRNRVQEICVPNIADLPVWKTVETWRPPPKQQEAAS